MKRIFSIVIILLCFTTAILAQNIPDGSTISGSPTYTETAPLNFDQVTPALPNPAKYNYNRVYTPTEPMTTIPAHSSLGNTKLSVATTYTDGWGRPIEDVVQLGPWGGIIKPYDLRARKKNIDYLPYPVLSSTGPMKFKNQTYTQQADYYNTNFGAEGNTAYSKSVSYSNNGLQTSASYSPGKEYTGAGRGVVSTMHIGNSSNISGATTLYKLEYNSGANTICTTGTYTTSEYVVTRVEGQHNAEVLQFTDKSGRVICKKEKLSGGYLITYYVYNLLGQLINMVPPAQSARFATHGCVSNILPASGPAQVFTYTYNKYGQNTASQTPGKEGMDRVVYDQYHRPFLSQSPAMAVTGKAYFTLYDKMGRVVMTGLFNETQNMSQSYYDGIINGTTSLPNYLDAQSQAVPNANKLEYWLLHDVPVNVYPEDGNGEPYMAGCEIHTLNYYDRYDIAPANLVSFYTGHSSMYRTDAGAEVAAPYYAVHGEPVATQTRILDNGQTNNWQSNRHWITSVTFYDEKGRTIQTHTLNPWQSDNWDIATMQYNFSGQNILSVLDHKGTALGNKGNGTIIQKQYTYEDYNGRLKQVQQKIDNDAWYVLANYTYDRLGRLEHKSLGNVEIQNYSYNISGQLTGINAGYVQAGSIPSGTSSTYATELNYEAGFSNKRYDGKVSGYKWLTTGSPNIMAYGYNYDDAGRMTHAEYRYKSSTWIKTAKDYTVSDLAYDANGNIQSMAQRGFDPAAPNAPIDIDDLTYSYDATGTRLMSVTDATTVPGSADIRHFEDNNKDGNDYEYDKNGNLKKDKNRGVNSIAYNFQDMPQVLEKTNNDGEVVNIYTADGALLQKVITDNTQTPAVVTTYHYWGPFVYKNDDLEMLMHDEGRCRYDGTDFFYDYFVKDHLGNVRNIVKGTMTYGNIPYSASFELIASNMEEDIFDQIGTVRDTRPLGTPTDLSSGILNGSVSTERIGASLVVHAMAGEKFNLQGYGYYESEDVEQYNTYTMPGAMLTSLSNALGDVIGGGGGEGPPNAALMLDNMLTLSNYNAYNTLKNTATNSNYPRAYLNYLVFDESFELQADYSHVVQLQGAANAWQIMQVQGDQVMPMNGYLMVYFSNESHIDVAVDNLYLVNYESELLEEQHYYPHGLVVQAGGQGTVTPENQYLAQGNKLQTELNLFINDFNYRQYDAQIGRFMAVDPLADDAQEHLNPYQFCFNDPGNFADPLGLKGGIPCPKNGGGGSCGGGGINFSWIGDFFKWFGGLFEGVEVGGEFAGGSAAGSGYLVIAPGGGGSSGSPDGGGPGGGSGSSWIPLITDPARLMRDNSEQGWHYRRVLGWQQAPMLAYGQKMNSHWAGVGGSYGTQRAVSNGGGYNGIGQSDPTPADGWRYIMRGRGGTIDKRAAEVLNYNIAQFIASATDHALTIADIMPIGGGAGKSIKHISKMRKLSKAIRVLKPLGKGSTGRTIARSLKEQLAMKEILGNPKAGKIIKESIRDPRWKGWKKMTNKNEHGVEIHFNAEFNKKGEMINVDDFKFIDP